MPLAALEIFEKISNLRRPALSVMNAFNFRNPRLVVCALCLLCSILSYPCAGSTAVWQFAAPVDEHGGLAHLYIPPQCQRVRGAIIALDNLLEKTLLEDPQVREAAGAEDLAIIWIAADADGKRPFDKGFHPGEGDGQLLDKILSGLAENSGYSELATVPLLPLGHSAGVPFAVEVGCWNPGRTIAIVDVKSVLPPLPNGPHATLEGIPLLIVKGQFEEWAKPPAIADREASWHSERKAALGLRAHSDSDLVGFVLDAGGGHFESDDALTQLIAMFIRKAAQYRLTPVGDGPSSVKVLKASDGWLTDSATAVEEVPLQVATYQKFNGPRQDAFWYFDEELATAVRSFGLVQRGKVAQFVTFSENGHPCPLAPRGTVELKIHPQEDGRTFEVDGSEFDKVPPGITDAGAALTPAAGRVRVNVVRGPVVQVGENTFRIQFDCCGFSSRAVDLWLEASQPGDAMHRRAVQPGHVSLPKENTQGIPQTIIFPEIADLPAGKDSMELTGRTDTGLPIEYYVLNGPAKIADGKLWFTPLPPRTHYPVDVTVVAYQWGRTIEPYFQSATPVVRTFHLTRN